VPSPARAPQSLTIGALGTGSTATDCSKRRSSRHQQLDAWEEETLSEAIELARFVNLRLRSGFVVAGIELSSEPMVDPLGREAVAHTRVVGRRFSVLIRAGLSDAELSVTLYHEILEAAAVASVSAPLAVIEFNEADFERAARAMHDMVGLASPENLDRMLEHFGFSDD
jgi:hypothetical protein